MEPLTINVVLISTYEMGRQPFGLASPAAWLRALGANVRCLDLSLDSLNIEAIRAAHLVAFYIPMHTATRLAIPLIAHVRQVNPAVHVCCFGLYAPVNAAYLHEVGVDTILGGEFESGLVKLAKRLSGPPEDTLSIPAASQIEPPISLQRQQFLVPDRSDLPGLSRYAHLTTAAGQSQVAGYTEASRGCKHLCRHCPVVPVYGGHFRVVQREVVLADIRQQIKAGARHVTFGDPDFFNGPGHAIPLVTTLHDEFPGITYDVTIKVEHLRQHARHLETLKKTGCLFITTAVESFDERILAIFEKNHSPEDFEAALLHCRQLGLPLVPTFVAFTPWTTLKGYRTFLTEIARLGLVDLVAPIQYCLRLLIPPGSRLLELAEVRQKVGDLDLAKLSYQWHNPDRRVDRLQQDLESLVYGSESRQLPRRLIFQKIRQRAHRDSAAAPDTISAPDWPGYHGFVPYLTEPWYC